MGGLAFTGSELVGVHPTAGGGSTSRFDHTSSLPSPVHTFAYLRLSIHAMVFSSRYLLGYFNYWFIELFDYLR